MRRPMTTIQTTARVDADGNVVIALGEDEAGTEVNVTITPARPKLTQAEWEALVDRTAGSITDPTFVRPPQGVYEGRDPL